jgi:hypothetical protein
MLGKSQTQPLGMIDTSVQLWHCFYRRGPALSLQILSCEFFRTVSRLCGKQPVFRKMLNYYGNSARDFCPMPGLVATCFIRAAPLAKTRGPAESGRASLIEKETGFHLGTIQIEIGIGIGIEKRWNEDRKSRYRFRYRYR